MASQPPFATSPAAPIQHTSSTVPIGQRPLHSSTRRPHRSRGARWPPHPSISPADATTLRPAGLRQAAASPRSSGAAASPFRLSIGAAPTLPSVRQRRPAPRRVAAPPLPSSAAARQLLLTIHDAPPSIPPRNGKASSLASAAGAGRPGSASARHVLAVVCSTAASPSSRGTARRIVLVLQGRLVLVVPRRPPPALPSASADPAATLPSTSAAIDAPPSSRVAESTTLKRSEEAKSRPIDGPDSIPEVVAHKQLLSLAGGAQERDA